MVRMELSYNMDFCKRDNLTVFQMFKFGSEIFEILQKCFCKKFLQEIAFYHLFGDF